MRGSDGGRCVVLLHCGENQCARQGGMAASAFGFGLKLQEVKAPVVRHIPPERIQGVDEGGKKPDRNSTNQREEAVYEDRRATTYQRRKSMCSLFHAPSLAHPPSLAIMSDTTSRCAADK
jgi:hypothetical protein